MTGKKRGRRGNPQRRPQKPIPHQCLFCSKIYYCYFALELHLNLHTGEKPYDCEECDASFSDYRYLSNHRNSSHSKSIMHRCRVCAKDFFSDPSTFYRHQKVCGRGSSSYVPGKKGKKDSKDPTQGDSDKERLKVPQKRNKLCETDFGGAPGNVAIETTTGTFQTMMSFGWGTHGTVFVEKPKWDSSFFLHMNRYVPDDT